MEPSLSDLDLEFSISEFEQAGLLFDTDRSHEVESGAIPDSAPQGGGGPRSGVASTSEQSGTVNQDSGLARPTVLDETMLPGAWGTPNLLQASSGEGSQGQHLGEPVGSYKKQQQNREHQRRFRQRQKAQSNVVENQLASTLTEVQELRIQKQQLEQKLQQAESSLVLPTNQGVVQSGADDVDTADTNLDHDGESVLTMSIRGKGSYITAEEVRRMSTEQYAALWNAYTHELTSLLRLVRNLEGTGMESKLNQLTFEAIMLRDTRLKTDVNSARFMSDEPASFFAHLLTLLNLSEEQVQDLMLLRRLFIVKRLLLSTQRARLTARMQEQSPDLISDALKASSIATQLGNNAAQDRQMFHRFTWGVYCGILSARQSAEAMVHAGPQQCIIPGLLTYIADQRGFPSIQHIKDAADGIAVADEWAHVWRYTATVNPYVSRHVDYVPIQQHRQAAVTMYQGQAVAPS